jgi:hypothetical protein
MSRWQVPRTVIRLTANGLGQTWIYQFPPDEWRTVVRKIMADTRAGGLPESAAGGLLELIAEGVSDDE